MVVSHQVIHLVVSFSHEHLNLTAALFLFKSESLLKSLNNHPLLLDFDLFIIFKCVLQHVVVSFHCEELASVLLCHLLVIALKLS